MNKKTNTKKYILVTLGVLVGILLISGTSKILNNPNILKLSKPIIKSNTSIEAAIKNRRSIRNYKKDSLDLKEISQILWAAQGITDNNGQRSVPSAKATYPIEIYVASSNVKDLDPGIYKYNTEKNSLIKIIEGNKTEGIYNAGLKQDCIKNGSAIIIICGVYEKTNQKHGQMAKQYVDIEAGAVAQNIYLQTVSLKIGTVFVGAFDVNKIKDIINAESNEQPIGIMPIGKI